MNNEEPENPGAYMLVLNDENKIERDYGHSGHSGYGHSGYGHSGHSGYGHDSGYGSYGYTSYGGHCCPLVLDPLLFLSAIGIIISLRCNNAIKW